MPGREGAGPRRATFRSPRGFALVLAVLAIVLIGAVVTGGYFLSTRQFRVGKARLRTNSALYAAEAGLSAALAGWDVLRAEGLDPGRPEPFMSGRLSTGDGYQVWLTRLDAGTADPVAYYLLRSMGRARGAYGGRREVDLLLRSQVPEEVCCETTLLTRGEVTIGASAAVSGRDTVPPAWADVCPVVGPDRPGVRIDGSLRADGSVVGDPPVQDTTLSVDDFFLYGDLDYGSIAQAADLVYEGASTSLAAIAPAVGADGRCERSVVSNWGAPEDAGHPCFTYFPVIHASGDLRIGRGRGQGVLEVDGDLIIEGDWTFYGAVMVRGRVEVAGGSARVYGGLWVYDEAGVGWTLGGASRLGYSSCVAGRALRYSELNRAQPLARRPWMELLN